MNVVLRAFGVHGDDWTRVVVRRCPECGQAVCEERIVRPPTALEQAVDDYQNDRIGVSELERRVATALQAATESAP